MSELGEIADSLPVVPDDRPSAARLPSERSRQTLLGCDTRELEALAEALEEPSYRGRQLAHWLYRRGARTLEEMADLPTTLRERLAETTTVGRSQTIAAQSSADGTMKLLLQQADDRKIETV